MTDIKCRCTATGGRRLALPNLLKTILLGKKKMKKTQMAKIKNRPMSVLHCAKPEQALDR